MLLGEIIARFGDEAMANDMLLALEDERILAAARDAAAAEELSLDAWARASVTRFTTFANDEQWFSLLTACQNASDPGSAALQYMLNTVLAYPNTASGAT
jgi:hypothetical protein